MVGRIDRPPDAAACHDEPHTAMRLRFWRRSGAEIPVSDRGHEVTHEQALRLIAKARRTNEILARFEANPNEGYETPERSD